ncbi:hypothetical protein AVBRAN12640_02175 [Campylobacter sp. RM12640]|uniref:hypothetical protein n=1 Tax=unclassified Campylobacter TaxID=2593542 RepID=UPI001BD918C3|nr:MULTISPECIES: hypothetical protein [unclassified Campylobacter]MBZ7978336.1 hypothetical protein [Campylobacter sp. RM12654]MBZ7981345.1 hypothetical protein [Campylobacter sp. RM12640]MBZ7984004.1 hypothetical protein [Campylobacter sp. RM12647]MBZ7989112.1 hypothetical protein [Campylobacter sp. RM12635]MBZ7991330.1 hypothetical protein [Campylobacter sp. RM9331]MBZ7993033.1 hypothetical protein [Campylobacter sp. RM9333]MBZ8005928.1 hypothetical protein [Campylobacter sp. RM9332]
MRTDNYIAFVTVCGFFIGFICAVFKIDDPFMMIGFTLFTTFVFYILIHLVVLNFVDAKKLGSRNFDKFAYENTTNHFIKELEIRENRMDKIIQSVESELEIIKKQTKPARKYNAKAA